MLIKVCTKHLMVWEQSMNIECYTIRMFILTFYAFLAKYVRAGNARNILKCDTT